MNQRWLFNRVESQYLIIPSYKESVVVIERLNKMNMRIQAVIELDT